MLNNFRRQFGRKADKSMRLLLTAGGFGVFGLYTISNNVFDVDGGHRAIMFSRLGGTQDRILAEGTHIKIPFLEEPTIYDVRAKPRQIRSPTGTKDLQMVDITLRVLYKPSIEHLPVIHRHLGPNFAERVLPSIMNETLKSVVALYNANELIKKRQEVSNQIRTGINQRARAFNIVLDDVSITHLTFGTEYRQAIEDKQIAQQEAARAKFLVKQAMQDKQSTIIKAEGEAVSAKMIGEAVSQNPAYVELRQLEAARAISEVMAKSNANLYLDSDSLLMNTAGLGDAMGVRMSKK